MFLYLGQSNEIFELLQESISNENDDLSLSIADEKKEEAVPSQQTAFDKEIEKKLSKCEAQNAEKLSKTETILSVEESPNVEGKS